MKKVLISMMLVLILLTGLVCSVSATTTVSGVRTTGCHTLDAKESILGSGRLIDNANAIFVYELTSDSLMYEQNADEMIEPASLVKIMTCLIAVEDGNMADAVTIKSEVIDTIPEDATNVSLVPEEVLTLEQLMYCMMVNSANDAAAVIADHIAGSQEAFVEKMNAYAKELGCTNTNFTNVTGLYDAEQYTTVRDLAKILNKAYKNELFMTFFSEDQYEIFPTNKSDTRWLLTGNYLLSKEDVEIYYDERVTGGRTGVTNDYSRSVAVTAEHGNMQLICIITGAASQLSSNGYSVSVFGGYNEVSDLLDICFDGYHVAQVIFDGQTVMQEPVMNGDCDVILGTKEFAYAVVPEDTTIYDLTYNFVADTALTAPIKLGQVVGSVDVIHKNVCVAQAEVYAMNEVREQQSQVSEHVNITPDDSGSILWIILVVLILVVIVASIPTIVKTVNRKVSIIRVRKNRHNRRRSR